MTDNEKKSGVFSLASHNETAASKVVFTLASYSVIAANKEDVITTLRCRHRWAGQNAWNRENMKTESCQFPAALDARLRRCCAEAGISRSQLIRFMLMEWMDAWEARKEKNGREDFTDQRGS